MVINKVRQVGGMRVTKRHSTVSFKGNEQVKASPRLNQVELEEGGKTSVW